MSSIQLIAGRSHFELADKISKKLKIPLTPVQIKEFADGEIYVRVNKRVRGDDIYIIQSLVAPVNNNLMEMLILIDALKRSSVGRINLICPYMCYSRQDRKAVSREPISAKLLANLITKAGANRIITVDLHADQIQGFYDIPVDHFMGCPQFIEYIKKKNYKDLVIVSPDIGGVKRANKMADLMGVPLAIIDKIRRKHNEAEVAHVVGEVEGKTAVLVDDMIDTGGSIAVAAKVLKEYGAKKVIVCATHGLLSGNAVEKLDQSPADEIILLDSVPLSKEKKIKKIKVLSIAPLLAKIIERVHEEKSLGELFTWEKQ